MIPKQTRNVISFLRRNVDDEVETIEEARRFARRMEAHFSETERLCLSCALRSPAQLRQFDAAFRS